MNTLTEALADPENQPHQRMGNPEGLEEAIQGSDGLSFSVKQAENGYLIQQNEPTFKTWIFRSAEEAAQFIALTLFHLPH